jgi:hypothetical protein
LRAIGFPRQIRRSVTGSSSVIRNRRRRGGEFLFRARRKKNGGTFFCKKMSDGPAYSTAGAGDECNLILELHKVHENRRKEALRQAGQPWRSLARLATRWPRTVRQFRCNSPSANLKWLYSILLNRISGIFLWAAFHVFAKLSRPAPASRFLFSPTEFNIEDYAQAANAILMLNRSCSPCIFLCGV